MATERDAYSTGPIGALIDRGEERGCVDLKEVDQLAQALGAPVTFLGRVDDADQPLQRVAAGGQPQTGDRHAQHQREPGQRLLRPDVDRRREPDA